MAEYIEREEAKRFLENIDAGRKGCSTLLTPIEFAEYLDEIEPSDVVPVRHGKWEFRQSERYKFCTDAVCTACNTVINSHHENNLEYRQTAIKEQLRYCPKCGARMDW